MKTPSQLKGFPFKDDPAQSRPACLVPPAMWLARAMAVLALVNLAPLADGADACRHTAQTVFLANRAGALSDYDLALAKAANISDPAARRAAREQAAADYCDALATSKKQRAVRIAACEKLGPAAYDPVIDPANFVAAVTNPYFPLTPGKTFIYEGQTSLGLEHSEFAVTHKTRVILGVTCVEVRDTVKHDGVVTEDTLDWFAQDKAGNVWYFGENTHEIENGLITTIDGTFMGGVAGDKPGIIMKANPKVGDFYRQEFSLGNAEDFAETRSVTETVTVIAGTFSNCLKSRETTPLETDLLEHKFYAPGIGNILTVDARTGERVELIKIKMQ